MNKYHFLFIIINNNRDEWEIDVNELEFGEQLGQGGNGQVHKGLWKGTEVAIKMMTADQVTRDMERNFKEEVRASTHVCGVCGVCGVC
jgi:predicted Ser/Thr protein kinase